MAARLLALLLLAAPGFAGEAAPAPAPAASKSGKLEDIVIKAKEEDEPSAGKPPLELSYDAYESLRPTLKPDEKLLLAESPALSAWVRSRPERLRSEHLLQPWNDPIEELAAIRLPARAQLQSAFGRELSASELKALSWSLSLVDEEGASIRKFEGSGAPPQDLEWDGLAEGGEAMSAGHAYSAVYKFWLSSTTSRTAMGQPIQFAGLIRKDGAAHRVALDSSQLFGSDRAKTDLTDAGRPLLRSAADWVRRRSWGSPVSLKVYGRDEESARSQALSAKAYLAAELGVPPERIPSESVVAAASDQRLELKVGD